MRFIPIFISRRKKPHSASEFYDRTIIVSGLSKSLSMTGWRVGWVASSQTEVVRASLVLHGFLTVCTSTISQKASLLGWTDEAEKAKAEAREIYKRRGEFLVKLLKDELNLRATSPEGAFYTMLDVRSVGDESEVAEKFLQNRVITVPGIAFGTEAKGFLRLSFCNTGRKISRRRAANEGGFGQIAFLIEKTAAEITKKNRRQF